MTNKIKIKTIHLVRGTGPIADCGKFATVGDYDTADIVLWGWSDTCPNGEHLGCEDKIDFVITFEDGETYEGTYHLPHYNKEDPDLRAHVEAHLKFYGCIEKPAHLSDHHWEVFCTIETTRERVPLIHEFMEKYDILPDVA